ncbi:dihydrodipicolinate synthase family protein [Nonomuraea longispora]|uniref:Dihydrodipicolinate synthase family protein n=1 Tax=Nonomuraea longispora TaxID=1848320 RepID=A0A4R4N6J8_9ACTN|nr:dihydrodipicolinate synthase family protein [Nonomuraea longispora]TDC02740.1 dihydrodipicolinate synthase family protein [Nonomuraea longispora]
MVDIDPRAAELRDRLRGTLIAAAATPMTGPGEIDLDVVARYLSGLVADGATGLAVLAHTGRGPFLASAERAAVVECAAALDVPVLVGVGGGPCDAAEQARAAADLGADGVLVFPSEGDRAVLHEQVWRAARLPMVAFDLYTRPCPTDVMREVLRHPGVAGLKTALLSDAMGCQRAIALARESGRLAITGEDRMFGPSLLWGAEAALVGVAAAAVGVTAEVMRAFGEPDLRAFERASGRLDRLAAATFTEPMEGYVQRMLWLAAAEGRIPALHACDPYGPGLPEGERRDLLAQDFGPAEERAGAVAG